MTMTCACRMQSYAIKELGREDIIYLSHMHITQSALVGHHIQDIDPELAGFDMIQ